MARETLRTQIAFRCSECGYATVGFLGGLTAVTDLLRLKCECGGSSLDIKKENDGKVRLTVPCVYCKSSHGYVFSPEVIVRRELTKLSCPYSGMDIAFVGDEELIPSELDRTAEELSRIMTSFEAEELSDIQPQDVNIEDEVVDPAVYDTLNFLVRDLEADGCVKCPCDNGVYSLRFCPEGVQVYCENCGASHTFYATTPTMAEEYLGLERIELK